MNPNPNIFAAAQQPAPTWQPPGCDELNAEFAETPKASRYRVHRLIAATQMSAVYEGMDTNLDRRVAVKILSTTLLTDDAFVRRFHDEARTLVSLQHPHIVRILDRDETMRGTLFIVMEYLEGPTLAQEIALRAPFTEEETITIARSLADALGCVHQQRTADGQPFLHRDLKPGNIILHEGQATLIDFGISQGARGTDTAATLTGALPYTDAYLAPELRIGGKPSIQSDLWALGKIIDEMLHGTAAHPVTRAEPVSRALRAIIEQAKADQPNRRQDSAAALCAELDALETSATSSPPMNTQPGSDFASLPPEHQELLRGTYREHGDPSRIKVEFDVDRITIEGFDFSLRSTVDDLEFVLGPSDRNVDEPHHGYYYSIDEISRRSLTYYWDRLGIAARLVDREIVDFFVSVTTEPPDLETFRQKRNYVCNCNPQTDSEFKGDFSVRGHCLKPLGTPFPTHPVENPDKGRPSKLYPHSQEWTCPVVEKPLRDIVLVRRRFDSDADTLWEEIMYEKRQPHSETGFMILSSAVEEMCIKDQDSESPLLGWNSSMAVAWRIDFLAVGTLASATLQCIALRRPPVLAAMRTPATEELPPLEHGERLLFSVNLSREKNVGFNGSIISKSRVTNIVLSDQRLAFRDWSGQWISYLLRDCPKMKPHNLWEWENRNSTVPYVIYYVLFIVTWILLLKWVFDNAEHATISLANLHYLDWITNPLRGIILVCIFLAISVIYLFCAICIFGLIIKFIESFKSIGKSFYTGLHTGYTTMRETVGIAGRSVNYASVFRSPTKATSHCSFRDAITWRVDGEYYSNYYKFFFSSYDSQRIKTSFASVAMLHHWLDRLVANPGIKFPPPHEGSSGENEG